MNTWIEALLAVFLLTGLMLAASSRLLHCIRLMAVQGILLGILPLLTAYPDAMSWKTLAVMLVNIGIKGAALPYLLTVAMRKANVRRELEPLIGYSSSLLIVLALLGLSFWVGTKLPLQGEGVQLVMPIAFSTMLTGLFIVMARRKAITQTIGFLTFENGISLFGAGLMLEFGLVVELGILLDVFALVFIMGIAVLRINHEFEHIDADRLNHLSDGVEIPAEPAEKRV